MRHPQKRQPDDMWHRLWYHVREPFHRIHCEQHEWECYDCNRAGCVKCGARHFCEEKLVDNKGCPLSHNEDGSVCCTITGLCIPTIRYAEAEYIDTGCVVEKEQKSPGEAISVLYEQVYMIVEWFLNGAKSEASRGEEVDRFLQKIRTQFVRVLKTHKSERDKVLPCIPEMLARSVHTVSPRLCEEATPELCAHCAQRITKCLMDLGLCSAGAKRTDLVVGSLYLMKSGLVIKNVQWLPSVPVLKRVLPHESSLMRHFKLSTKLICSTENELKLALRQREKML